MSGCIGSPHRSRDFLVENFWPCRCDVSSKAETHQLAKEANLDYAVGGYLHAGGILNDALLTRQTADHIRQVFAPKHYGAVNLAQVAVISILALYATHTCKSIGVSCILVMTISFLVEGSVLDAKPMHEAILKLS